METRNSPNIIDVVGAVSLVGILLLLLNFGLHVGSWWLWAPAAVILAVIVVNFCFTPHPDDSSSAIRKNSQP